MSIGWRAKATTGIAAALLALPALVVFAQTGEPPAPPYGLVFGTAGGAAAGRPVVAIVSGGGTSAACGHDVVKTDASEGAVYAVSINAQSQTPGCGANGRQARIYFIGSGGQPSAFGSPSFTLDSTYQGGKRQNLTLDTPLANRLYTPGLRANQ